ncbi:hypothetical protein, partial [Arthrobacter sp. E3]|uniref:hypothetical protein n=1 Tax=Arthrobacter sp. E3 TaxID=517402 RepID=UPI001A945A57
SFPTNPKRFVVLKPGRQISIIDYFIDIPPLSNSPRNMRPGNESLLLTPPSDHHAVIVVVFGAP